MMVSMKFGNKTTSHGVGGIALLVAVLAVTATACVSTPYRKDSQVQAMMRDVYVVTYSLNEHTPSGRGNLYVMLRAADLAVDERMDFFTIQGSGLVGGTPQGWSRAPYFPEKDMARNADLRGGFAMLQIHLYASRADADAAVAATSNMAHPFVYDAKEVAGRLRPLVSVE